MEEVYFVEVDGADEVFAPVSKEIYEQVGEKETKLDGKLLINNRFTLRWWGEILWADVEFGNVTGNSVNRFQEIFFKVQTKMRRGSSLEESIKELIVDNLLECSRQVDIMKIV